jgi:hypothetical protein
MADNKTKPTKLSVAAFIEALTDQTKRADAKAIAKMMQRVTGEKPKMWGPRSSASANAITNTTAGARAICRWPVFHRVR